MKPLFVAIQGPQGIGKSTVTKALVSALSEAPYSLKAIGMSIDDLLWGHEALQQVAAAHDGNILLQGRGLPGTHDIALGADILQALFLINHPGSKSVQIPIYDKSLHDGQGDRLPIEQWNEVKGSIDVVIIEGWCLGFYPVSEKALAQTWEKRMELGMPASLTLLHGLQDVKAVNDNLSEYVESWYPYFSCFIQVSTEYHIS
jgi:D-glycerate 3-kinase